MEGGGGVFAGVRNGVWVGVSEGVLGVELVGVSMESPTACMLSIELPMHTFVVIINVFTMTLPRPRARTELPSPILHR